MAVHVFSCAHPEIKPLRMPDRFRHEITYFMTPSGEQGIPKLPPGEYWIRLADARAALDDGVVSVVSPLDSQSRAELELTEEQEQWLEWMTLHQVEHVRLANIP
jgi:hypothetical protein